MPPETTSSSLGCPNCGFDYGLSEAASEPVERLPSRVNDLLSTNEPPLDSELASIRDTVATRTERLATIDNHLSALRQAITDHQLRLQRAIDDLNKERELVASDIRDLKAVTSPLRRIPSDVILAIFLLCLDQYGAQARPVRPSSRESSILKESMPWVVIRICSCWRQIAIAYPRLWSSPNISFDSHNFQMESTGSKSKQIEALRGSTRVLGSAMLLATHLQRAGNRLLDMSLYKSNDGPSEHRLLQVLLPSSSRWATATISLLNNYHLSLLSPIHSSLESLHTLVLHHGRYEESENDDHIHMPFEVAPRLRTLRCFNMTGVQHLRSLPWAQITTYEWEYSQLFSTSLYDTEYKHIDVLRRMPNLSECILRCIGDSGTIADQTLTLPKLKRLTLKERRRGRALSLINQLTLPSLAHLAISHHERTHTDLPAAVHSLVDRSQCKITSLTLELHPADDITTIDLLRGLPMLEELVILNHIRPCHDLVSSLTYEADQARILPYLKSLSLMTTRVVGDHEVFVRMIESRCYPTQGSSRASGDTQETVAARLCNLYMSTEIPFGDPLLRSRFEQCCSDGLKLIVGRLDPL